MINNATIMGSTGSIGTQALLVSKKLGIKINAISGNKNFKLLEAQAREYSPRFVAVADKYSYDTLKITLSDLNTKVLYGREGICEAASQKSNIVLNSIVGIAGLPVTLAAIKAKNTLALANKESLVTAGEIVLKAASENNVKVIPVDSEHSAIFQCLNGESGNEIEKILLTCSGGPFFGKTVEELKFVTVEDTLKHPNWSMGKKITVDSATLMNKGFELIEAMHLFKIPPERIKILIHRQSVLHSAVEFKDGAIIAQLGTPDMSLPIQYAFTYPKRLEGQKKRLSLLDVGTLTFKEPDIDVFKCLKLTYTAIEKGGLYPALLNGANEKAVELFLKGNISFLTIGELIEKTLSNISLKGNIHNIDDVFAADNEAKEFINNYFERVKA